jgi:hypothetical protein
VWFVVAVVTFLAAVVAYAVVAALTYSDFTDARLMYRF